MLASQDTQRLTRARFEPTIVQRRAGIRPAAAVACIGLAGAALALALAGGGIRMPLGVDDLERRNAALTAELEHARVELEMERATRAELERQIDDLNGQVGELRQQIGFLISRGVH
jgi:TolA-binding protein